MENPFKLTLALGEMFCNRVTEIELLQQNIRSGIHTVIYAPRRYGKSSLAHIVLSRLDKGAVGIYIDLSPVTSSEDVAERLYRGIVEALGRTAADKSSFASRLASFFKNIKLGVSFQPSNSIPEFTVSLGDISAETHIETVIGALDLYCSKHHIKVCLVLDEFQQICELSDSKKVEALLRAGMQSVENVSFLMMGSRRTILRDMFEDRKRPFYKSSYLMQLPRIPDEEWVKFLMAAFKDKGLDVPSEDASRIVEFCDGYPYYVQKLSMLFFAVKLQGGDVSMAVDQLMEMETTDCENVFTPLTLHQKRLLRAIAAAKPTSLFTTAFIVEHRLGSQGGIQNSLAKLKSLDLVEQDQGQWKVVDPILAKWLLH